MQKKLAIAILAIALCFTGAAVRQQAAHAEPLSCAGKPGKTVSDTQGCGKTPAITPLLTCSGSGCDGLDPVQYGCDGNVSTIVQSPYFTSNGHTWVVQLRYSNSCHTVWTRLVETSGSGAALYNPVSEGSISNMVSCTGSTCESFPDMEYGVYDGAWTNMEYVGSCGSGDFWTWNPAAWNNNNLIQSSINNYTTCTREA